MKEQALFFTGTEKVEVRSIEVGAPGTGQLRVRTRLSGISPGTEMLIYRGLAPEELPLDDAIRALTGNFHFPFQYGYCCLGEVEQVGSGVDSSWLGQRVFSFQPHQSAFLASPDELLSVPTGISDDSAIFLPNTETAVNLVMDGQPIIGERVAVFGLGVMGLLTTAILAQFPLAELVGFEILAPRLELGKNAGAFSVVNPLDAAALAAVADNFDLVYEISGVPQALNQAISVAGFDSRVVVGSWYGKKRVELDLGGKFHRSRIRLISSQVSTVAPGLSGRWDKARRLRTAWQQVQRINPQAWITHKFPVLQATEAYELLRHHPEQTLQVVLTYA